jgi:phage antirepressor YoqD-like protein
MENSNMVPNGNGNKMMSSREIAQFTNKRHADVMRDIREIETQLSENHNERTSAPVKKTEEEYHRGDRTQYKYIKESDRNFFLNFFNNKNNLLNNMFLISEYIDGKGEKRPEYLLTKKQTLLLISGYNVLIRSKIIDRWEELEKQQIETRKLPTNFVEALKELVASEEKIILLEVENQKLKPRDEFVTKVFETNDLLDIGEVAKILKLDYGRNTLYAVLKEKGIFFKSKNEPYQEYINKGYFELKESLITKTQPPKTIIQTFVTQKGLGFIAKKLGVITI